jgi:hypothetical protein
MIETAELVALESSVWEALRTGDAAADLNALGENFLGVYPSGFANRADHVGQLADGPTIGDFEITSPRSLALSDDVMLLAYRANFRRPGSGSSLESMYVSSVWSRQSGQWLNLFSQDTPVVASDTDPQ